MRATLLRQLSDCIFAAMILLSFLRGQGFAESPATPRAAKPAASTVDPFESVKSQNDPFETVLSDTPVDAAAYVPPKTRWDAHQTNFDASQTNSNTSPIVPPPAQNGQVSPAAAVPKDPCAAAVFKPLCQLGISIAQPTGDSPTDFATPCWNQINAGPNGGCRCWPAFCYQWEATCLCYNPLYFEEVNAERYGYVCGCCYCCGDCWMQPACSAAHFFGTVPCLPYCMLADCPTECVYTLGHYRPGDCVRWRWNYPPCDPVAAVGTAGIYTGFIFAIP
jgi:hypothetical protein